MSLVTGTKLGPFEVASPLGAGGMGEVYRARDTRLNRDVALKVLPETFANDPQRMARFEREAQVLASLNHPNIAAIYGLEESGSTRALVMELIEGQTLAQRIAAARSGVVGAHRAVPLQEDFQIAKQVAEALEYAHERGVIHRDLKPSNIKITPEGTAKVLDFGLAKAMGPDEALRDISNSPTLSAAMTEAGFIIGTAAYMAPEQAKAKPLDRRADIWAFGCVFYEMLTGASAFSRTTLTETIVAVMGEEPDWAAMPRDTPASIERLLRRCLTKDLRHRLQAIGEARIAIEEVLTGDVGAIHELPLPEAGNYSSPFQRARPWATALAVAVLAALGGWLVGHKASRAAPPTYQQITFDRGLIYSARFAADGQSVYYSASWNGQPIQVYSTNPSGPESRPLNLTNSALFAVSSSQIAISMGCKDMLVGDCEGTLAVAPLSGGARREIVDRVLSAAATPDGSSMAVVREAGGKFRVEFPPGNVIYESETWVDFLRISPRGTAVAFVQFGAGGSDTGRVVILDRKGKQIARSGEEFTSVEGLAWPPAGNEVWCAASMGMGYANAIYALSFTGKDRIVLRLPGMLRLYDISRDGRILLSKDVWRSGMQWHGPKDPGEHDLSWLDAPLLMDLSTDGQDVEFSEFGGTVGASALTYLRTPDGSPPVKLGHGYVAALSPDGKWVLATDFPPRLVLLPTGVGEAKNLKGYGLEQFTSVGWMPSGKEVYFAGNGGHGWRMYAQQLAGGALRALTPSISVNPDLIESHLLSPDGKFVFARDLNGRGWLYLLAGGNPKAVQGLAPGDIWINWSSDGCGAYVYQDDKTHAQVFRINLAKGKRQTIATLRPADPAGLNSIGPVRITPDGRSYAYSYDRSLSDLYLVGGVK